MPQPVPPGPTASCYELKRFAEYHRKNYETERHKQDVLNVVREELVRLGLVSRVEKGGGVSWYKLSENIR